MLAESFQHGAKNSLEHASSLNALFSKPGAAFSSARKDDLANKKLNLLPKGHPQLTPEVDKCSSVNSIYEMQWNQSNFLKPELSMLNQGNNKSGGRGNLGDRLKLLTGGDRGAISRGTSAFKSPNQSALVKQG